jgi:hypothetical protein
VTALKVRIGEVNIDAVIEREGPWRRPQDFFPAYDDAAFKRHLQVMEPEVFDSVSGMMLITYQSFAVRTPHHSILWVPVREKTKGTRHHSISPARSAGGMNCSPTTRLTTCSASLRWGTSCGLHLCRAACPSSCKRRTATTTAGD